MTLGFAISLTAKQVPGQPAAKFGREVMIKPIRIVVVIVAAVSGHRLRRRFGSAIDGSWP
jgi:hypothetical protein